MTAPHGVAVCAVLNLLVVQYPAYAWWVDTHPDGPRYIAVASDLVNTRPTCVITSDPAEFRAHLGDPAQ